MVFKYNSQNLFFFLQLFIVIYLFYLFGGEGKSFMGHILKIKRKKKFENKDKSKHKSQNAVSISNTISHMFHMNFKISFYFHMFVYMVGRKLSLLVLLIPHKFSWILKNKS